MKRIKQTTQKGFTLIELLVVIAILGVLAAGVLVGIDPVDRINSANDSRAQNDVGTSGRASEAYATAHNGFYPAVLADLVANGDLKILPAAPGGYTYTVANVPAGCAAGTTCTAFGAISNLKSKKFTSTCTAPNTPFWRYDSSNGKSCSECAANAAATTACP